MFHQHYEDSSAQKTKVFARKLSTAMFLRRSAEPTSLLVCIPDLWWINECQAKVADASKASDNPAFCIHEETSTDIRQPGEKQLHNN